MRRSLCMTEPKYVQAGHIGNWNFFYTPSTNLPKGTFLKFDLLSKGREVDWQIPSVAPTGKANTIWAELPNGKKVSASLVEIPGSIIPQYEFQLPIEVKAGETLKVILGSADEKKVEKQGNIAQKIVQRRRPFHLYIDPKGKRDYKEPEIFNIDVKGNSLDFIRIIAPSLVAKNQRFDVIVRFEDQYGNLTNMAPEGTLVELSYEQLRENLNWKLFIPETGFILLPNLYFNESGLYRLQLKNLKTKEVYYSAPIKCFPELEKNLYWGSLHNESDRYDAGEHIEACLRHFRDDRDMNFFATSPFENEEETSPDSWKTISNHTADFNEADRFVTFLGFQWNGIPGEEGLRQILYFKDSKPLLRKKDSKSNQLKKIYKSHTPKDLISVPCFTMGKSLHTDFTQFVPEFERVVEIYNAWGSSECMAKEGNPRPIYSTGKTGIFETSEGSIRSALNQNCRMGFVAGGLDDRGSYAGLYESEQKQYSPGLTAILAKEQSRDSIAQALYDRSCYATTGPRILIGFNIAGMPMGSELSSKTKPGLLFNRHITGYVAGTAPIKEILIIRNGKIFKSYTPQDESHFEILLDDTESLDGVVFPGKEEVLPFCYYYMRVEQKDGHLAWASPIWIDHLQTQPVAQPLKRKKKL